MDKTVADPFEERLAEVAEQRRREREPRLAQERIVLDRLGTIERQLAEQDNWDRVAAVVVTATRCQMQLTQLELADRLGWTRNTLVNLTSGRRRMRVSDLIRIAQALDVQPETLLRRVLQWNDTAEGEI